MIHISVAVPVKYVSYKLRNYCKITVAHVINWIKISYFFEVTGNTHLLIQLILQSCVQCSCVHVHRFWACSDHLFDASHACINC